MELIKVQNLVLLFVCLFALNLHSGNASEILKLREAKRKAALEAAKLTESGPSEYDSPTPVAPRPVIEEKIPERSIRDDAPRGQSRGFRVSNGDEFRDPFESAKGNRPSSLDDIVEPKPRIVDEPRRSVPPPSDDYERQPMKPKHAYDEPPRKEPMRPTKDVYDRPIKHQDPGLMQPEPRLPPREEPKIRPVEPPSYSDYEKPPPPRAVEPARPVEKMGSPFRDEPRRIMNDYERQPMKPKAVFDEPRKEQMKPLKYSPNDQFENVQKSAPSDLHAGSRMRPREENMLGNRVPAPYQQDRPSTQYNGVMNQNPNRLRDDPPVVRQERADRRKFDEYPEKTMNKVTYDDRYIQPKANQGYPARDGPMKPVKQVPEPRLHSDPYANSEPMGRRGPMGGYYANDYPAGMVMTPERRLRYELEQQQRNFYDDPRDKRGYMPQRPSSIDEQAYLNRRPMVEPHRRPMDPYRSYEGPNVQPTVAAPIDPYQTDMNGYPLAKDKTDSPRYHSKTKKAMDFLVKHGTKLAKTAIEYGEKHREKDKLKNANQRYHPQAQQRVYY